MSEGRRVLNALQREAVGAVNGGKKKDKERERWGADERIRKRKSNGREMK